MAAKPKPSKGRVSFHYLQGPAYRTVHADGAFGGVTPRGQIHFALYSERMAIPDLQVYELGADGGLGKEVADERISRDGYVRELQVDVVMTLESATNLRDWLTGNIKAARDLKSQKD